MPVSRLAGAFALVLLTFVSIEAVAQLGSSAGGGRRVALVIGNSAYRSVDRLANPASDARLMAATLREAGFTLIGDGPQLDLDKVRFDRAVQSFGRALPGADVALFYYSGHGMQVDGTNWLVPTDASPSGPRDLDFQMVDASLVLRQMEGSGTKLNMVVLDACRNNPFAIRGTRGGGQGLAEMRAPEGTVISYATQPGNTATDGSGGNSPYTSALVAAIRRPGADVFQVFNQVGLTVKQQTAGQQQPWLASSPISGSFNFFAGPVTIVQPQAGANPEVAYWQSIAASRDPADFQGYLRRYPSGTFAELATRRLSGLSQTVAAPAAAGGSGAFDGAWQTVFSCIAADDGAAGYARRFISTVRGGTLHGEIGVQNQAGFLALDGSIGADGSAMLLGQGLTGSPEYAVGRPRPASRYNFTLRSKFEGNRGTGTRGEVRPCSAVFSRQ